MTWPIIPDKVTFNYSSGTLSDPEKTLLARCLKFSIALSKLGHCDFLVPFDFLPTTYKNNISKDSGFKEEHNKTRLKDIALSGYRNFSPSNFLLTREDF